MPKWERKKLKIELTTMDAREHKINICCSTKMCWWSRNSINKQIEYKRDDWLNNNTDWLTEANKMKIQCKTKKNVQSIQHWTFYSRISYFKRIDMLTVLSSSWKQIQCWYSAAAAPCYDSNNFLTTETRLSLTCVDVGLPSCQRKHFSSCYSVAVQFTIPS